MLSASLGVLERCSCMECCSCAVVYITKEFLRISGNMLHFDLCLAFAEVVRLVLQNFCMFLT